MGDAPDNRMARLREMFGDVAVLFDYSLKQQKLPEGDKERIIAEYSQLNAKFHGEGGEAPFGPADEVVLYGLMDQLSRATQPVTTFSLKQQANLKGRLLSLKVIGLVFSLLVTVVLVQIHALIASNAIQEMQQSRASFFSLHDQLQRIQGSKPLDTKDESVLDLVMRQDIELERMISNSEILLGRYQLSRYIVDVLDDVVTWVKKREECQGANCNAHEVVWIKTPEILKEMRDMEPFHAKVGAVLNQSERLLSIEQPFQEAISLYVLPLLYGIMGAVVFFLRDTWQRSRDATLGRDYFLQSGYRIMLGAVLGACTGLFFTNDDGGAMGQIANRLILGEQSATSNAFSLALVAFIAGYSVDLVFALLDSFIQFFRNKFEGWLQSRAAEPIPQPAAPAPAPPPALPVMTPEPVNPDSAPG